MRPTSTQRNGRRYAYYVCLGGCGARLNSSRIEESVLHQLEGAAGSRRKVRRLVRMYGGREGIVSADVMDKLRAIVASITAILNSMSLPVNPKPNPPAKSSTLKATAKEYVEQPVLSWGKPTVLQSAQYRGDKPEYFEDIKAQLLKFTWQANVKTIYVTNGWHIEGGNNAWLCDYTLNNDKSYVNRYGDVEHSPINHWYRGLQNPPGTC